MNKLIPFLAFSILLLVPVGSQNAFAVSVPITNHSFEDPSLTPGTSSTTASGWILSNSRVANDLAVTPAASDGSNILIINQDPLNNPDGGTATQVVTTVAPDTRYILTYEKYASPFDNGNALVSIRVNGLHQASSVVDPDFPFQLFTHSITWDSPSSGPLIGQPLEIWFSGLVIFLGDNQGIFYDNIRLEALDLLTEVDDDGDTIPNGLDICPGQDDLLDTDGDGVPDCLDPEPNLGCGPGTSQVGTLCLPTGSTGLDCGIGTYDNGNGKCDAFITDCGAGTSLENGVCTLLEQCAAIGSMIGGALMDIDTTALLVASIGVNPVITALVGVTLAGVAVQAVWFVHQRKKNNS